MPAEAHEEMKTVHTLCGEYTEEDIYNMDETGFFWHKSPTGGLASHSQPRVKKDKTKILLVIYTNCPGTN